MLGNLVAPLICDAGIAAIRPIVILRRLSGASLARHLRIASMAASMRGSPRATQMRSAVASYPALLIELTGQAGWRSTARAAALAIRIAARW